MKIRTYNVNLSLQIVEYRIWKVKFNKCTLYIQCMFDSPINTYGPKSPKLGTSFKN